MPTSIPTLADPTPGPPRGRASWSGILRLSIVR
jgi:hypothetical protein